MWGTNFGWVGFQVGEGNDQIFGWCEGQPTSPSQENPENIIHNRIMKFWGPQGQWLASKAQILSNLAHIFTLSVP